MSLPGALASVTAALDRAGVRWFVGGSVASIAYGEIRTTQDLDVIADLAPVDVAPVCQALVADFFVDENFVAEAVRSGSSCNVVHRATGFKVDIFVLRRREFSRAEMDRRIRLDLAAGVRAYVATPEDCILTKLEWYEKGGRVSDRQWRDILGLLKARHGVLDLDHLWRWAPSLAVEEMLRRALREAGVDAQR